MSDHGRSAAVAASGLRPFGAEPQDASQAKPLVPNAAQPTHYCVVCAARWVNHPSWSLASEDCGPCCDNVPMDAAPIVRLQADGSVDGNDYRRVRGAYDAAQRKVEVDRYRGILCALCDEPFEHHFSDWTCRKRVAPRFKFPASSASGTEAGTGETEGLDPKGDGPTLEEGDAQ